MKETEKITEYLIKKYGYKKQPSPNPTIVNKRMRKMMGHFLLFYDEDKEKMRRDLNSTRKNVKYLFKFIQKNGLEDKYKKETLGELVLHSVKCN